MSSNRMRWRRWAMFAGAGLASWMAGCTSSGPATRPAGVPERAEAAVRDPFSYERNKDWPDVSGGDTGHLDKDGLNRDIDHVFNP